MVLAHHFVDSLWTQPVRQGTRCSCVHASGFKQVGHGLQIGSHERKLMLDIMFVALFQAAAGATDPAAPG